MGNYSTKVLSHLFKQSRRTDTKYGQKHWGAETYFEMQFAIDDIVISRCCPAFKVYDNIGSPPSKTSVIDYIYSYNNIHIYQGHYQNKYKLI